MFLRVRWIRLHSRIRRRSKQSTEVVTSGHHHVAVHRVSRLFWRIRCPHVDVTVLRASKYEKPVFYDHRSGVWLTYVY